ncbi:MAG: lipocalin-like domain-containing protein, partial [Verrucomicrobiota bacterium]
TTAEGFAIPQPGRVFSFPRDHGSHPEFKIEWWYLTGHLRAPAADGRRFGYQATFFRQASPDGSRQIHLAHMALSDLAEGRFLHQARLNRDGWDARASTETLDLRNGPWTLTLADPQTETMALRGGVRAEAGFAFTLTPAKPLVFFGEDGVSRKGDAVSAASHYLTFTRLRTAGELTIGERTFAVEGESWMDHEISSSQLDEDQVGWDWVSIHFNDGRELMVYRLRLADGGAHAASTLTWVDREARIQKMDFAWEPLTTWRSPRNDAVYPARVRLRTTDPATGAARTLVVEPLMADQELDGDLDGIAYWEGACRVLDEESGREIGSAYMELTGYDRPLDL